MPTSQSQRMRRLAEKASRRKAVVADRLFADGIGWMVVARTLPSGWVGASFFLVDVWRLCVKDAFFATHTPRIFAERMAASSENQPLIDVDPSVARKLLRDAVAYAASLGLAPSERFTEVEAIFGDIPLATETFPFGEDGKPFYVSGPNDSPTRIRRILETLAKRVGGGGHDFLVSAGGPPQWIGSARANAFGRQKDQAAPSNREGAGLLTISSKF